MPFLNVTANTRLFQSQTVKTKSQRNTYQSGKKLTVARKKLSHLEMESTTLMTRFKLYFFKNFNVIFILKKPAKHASTI